ncbi:MAG: PhoH family protein [Clostridiales bacterium]|nr:PhoH family protein [Clostridiales bacterium]MCF8022243.1 PhoH family protein [Clostridiales bacterium]
MLECLLDEETTCVTISGSAGTRKTLFALAAGLNRVENSVYHHFLACRPTISMGENLGFLPGSERDKIDPYMRPFYDNLRYLITTDEEKKNGYDQESVNSRIHFLVNKMITMQAVAFMRGRSISNNWIFIDEAQNLTPSQIRSIITRVGEGSKIIIAGDRSSNR